MESNSDSEVNTRKPLKDKPCIELRFLIPSKLAGSIIGKSGENIRSLRQLYNARINISDNNGPERVLSLEADMETILEILRHSWDKIELPRIGGGDMSDASNEVDVRLLVNQSLVGALIGKGGFRINELREKCALRVLKIYQNVCPNSTDRVVQMVGCISPAVDCISKVVDMCKDTPIREPKINYDALNYDQNIVHNYGGWSLNLPRQGDAVGFGSSSLGFSRSVMLQNQGAMFQNMPHTYNIANICRQNAPMPIRSTQFDDKDLNKDCIQTMHLSHRMIGAIIGPGGCRIQQIRLDSDAQITISGPDRNPQERTVTISGTTFNVRRAQSMINECMNKYAK